MPTSTPRKPTKRARPNKIRSNDWSPIINKLGTAERPLKVAIIGSGPSGLYATEALIKSGIHFQVTIFEKLPLPYGLVKYGVAPDHIKMRQLITYFSKVFEHPSVHLQCNTEIGKDITIETLRDTFDDLIFCYGCENDYRLDIPGKALNNIYTGREFVGWYNNHPKHQDYDIKFDMEEVAIIGLGNVALDIARILAKPPELLEETEISRKTLAQLYNSKIKTIHLIGRRSITQAAFTPNEFKELQSIPNCELICDPKYLDINTASREELLSNTKAKRNVEILKTFTPTASPHPKKSIILHFQTQPIAYTGNETVQGIQYQETELVGPAFKQKTKPKDLTGTIQAGIVLESIGYKGNPIHGLPFDKKKNILPNFQGKIDNHLYTSGWIKRGATGVIGTNKKDSIETVNTLLESLKA